MTMLLQYIEMTVLLEYLDLLQIQGVKVGRMGFDPVYKVGQTKMAKIKFDPVSQSIFKASM